MGTFTFSGTQIMVMIKGFLYNTHFLSFAPFFSLLSADVADVFTTWHEVLLVFLLYVQSHELLRNIFILTCEVCKIFIMLVLASLALNKSCVATRLMAGLLSKLDFFFSAALNKTSFKHLSSRGVPRRFQAFQETCPGVFPRNMPR